MGGGKIVTTFVGEPVRPIQSGFASTAFSSSTVTDAFAASIQPASDAKRGVEASFTTVITAGRAPSITAVPSSISDSTV